MRLDPGRSILRDLDSVSYAVLDAPGDDGLPEGPFLLENYPNPFNPSTTISFELPARSRVALRIFTILGEEGATIASGTMSPGVHRVSWDASGRPAGVDLAELVAEPAGAAAVGARLTRKMLYLR